MDVKTYFGFTQNEIGAILSCLRERERILRYRIAEDNLLLIMHCKIEAEQSLAEERVIRNQSELDIYTHLINELSAAQITNTIDSNQKEKYL